MQYKDAFFNANPDFKWYKLPAPPLRTLTSRPRDYHEQPQEATLEYEPELEKTNNNSTKLDFNKKPNYFPSDLVQKPLSMFTPGKLADEAHMGGLSSLLATKTETQTLNPYYSPSTYNYNQISYINERPRIPDKIRNSKEENIRELQNALSETTRVFEDFDEGEDKNYYNDQFTNQDVIDQIVDKRFSKDDEYDDSQKNWSDMKSGRSCKGKRYQEFMAVGGLLVNKRQKRDSDRTSEEMYNASCSWEPGNSQNDETVVDESKQNTHDNPRSNSELNGMPDVPNADNNANKTFKAADFDLDAKIRALPSLSLEKFQQKKRENKRKKKIVNFKLKQTERTSSDLIINSVPRPISMEDRREMAESWRETVIGSQKRKPRKISITRLEINSLVSSTDLNEAHKISPDMKIATEAPATVVQTMEIGKQSAHSNVDLFALATLAEVASNTSKIEDTGVLQNLAAKASEENASTV